jgi:hypothetical protein
MPTLAAALPSAEAAFATRASGGRSRELDVRLNDGAINVAEMSGFVGDGSTDDTAAWVAAAALAFTDKKSVCFPDGCKSKITDSIFFGDAANPTQASYSMGVFGMGKGLGNDTSRGSQIVTTFNDKPAFILGPGQGMYAGNFTIMGPSNGYRAEQNSSGIGLALSGGSGGISRALVENVGIANFHTGIQTGYANGALCDSVTIRKAYIANAAKGIYYSATQNFIQHVQDCGIEAQYALYNGLGINVEVESSNLSAVSGRVGTFTISSVSALTATASGNSFIYTFTAHVDNPDSNLAIVDGSNVPLILAHGAINLVGFGNVPVLATAYNSGTQVLSLQILPIWGYFHYGNNNCKTTTDLEAELQAASTLYLAERVMPFVGGGFNASSIHLENPTAVCTLIDTTQGFASGTGMSHIRQLYCNSSPDSPVGNNAGETTAKRRVQSSHPFIRINSTGLILESCKFNNDTDGINIDIDGDQPFEVRNPLSWLAPNVRYFTSGRNQDNSEGLGAPGSGAGIWYPTPFVPPTGGYSVDTASRTRGSARGEYWGWWPARDSHPRLTTAQVTTLGSLPTFTTGGNPSYVNICGETIYSVVSPDSGALATLFTRSAHKGFSWGQNFTTTNVTNLAWSYKGKSHLVRVNAELFDRMFPGLVILLNNGGGNQAVIVTGMSVRENYITVFPFDVSLLNGIKTVTYTGTAIGQQAYSFTAD